MANLQNVYFLKYNNYFNKILKKKNTIEDYIEYQVGQRQTDTNFIPGNGISTTHVINYGWGLNDNPDYVVVTDSSNNILSRWFVIDADRTRAGQYSLTLKRDILADEIDNILEAPAFITIGKLLDTDPMIFNDEAIKVNQILNSEVLLKDETGVPWIVAYLPKHGQEIKDEQGNVINWEGKTVNGLSALPNADFTFNSLGEALTAMGTGQRILTSFKAKANFSDNPDYSAYYVDVKYENSNYSYSSTGILPPSGYFYYSYYPSSEWYGRRNDSLATGLTSGIRSDHGIHTTLTAYSSILSQYNGKTISVDGRIYRVNITFTSETVINRENYEGSSTNTYLNVKNALINNEVIDSVNGNASQIIYTYYYGYKSPNITFTEILGININFEISSTRRSLRDQPYDMICLPYKDPSGNKVTIYKNNVEVDYDPDAMLNLATNLITTYGSSVVYDVQVLPYCPVRDLVGANGDILFGTLDIGPRVTPIKDDNDNEVGYVFYCYESSATFDIPYVISSDNPKLSHITEVYRLSSPNYDGEYEFDPFMNGGVEYFNVDFTYLPYQPWIKINPNYKYLYGEDLNDSRGLICGGNYSISQMNDAWANFQMNNVNYQNIFDRQIKNMKFNNKMQLIDQSISAGTSAITQGLGIGGLINPIAGVGSGIASALGGGVDLFITRQKQKEALGYTRDNFNYNLQNVQALPQTISKVTAFKKTYFQGQHIGLF